MNKVSVIIPVYNNVKYLERCLKSVFSQNMEQMEVICIDDGSTDESILILSDYANRYGNLRLFHQENKGAGSARNLGIAKASGEFIAFLDADDFYYDNMALRKLYYTAKESGALICGGSVCSFRNGILTLDNLHREAKFTRNGLMAYSDYPVCYGFWRFIYKKDLLVKNNIFFPDYRRCQDLPFLIKAMCESGYFYAVEDYVYCYRKEHKEVYFTRQKITDYTKGMRDCLILSQKYRISELHTEIINMIHRQLAAMMYMEINNGCSELISILEEINQAITEELIIKNRLICKSIYLLSPEEIPEYILAAGQRKEQFIERLKNCDNVYVYGAGKVGKRVVRFLLEQNVNIRSVVVTSKDQNPDCVENVKVCGIDEIVWTGDEIILIATFAYMQDEIEQEILHRDNKNIEKIDIEEFTLYERKFWF